MGRKLVLLFIFPLLSFVAFSQKEGLSIGLGVSPDYHQESFHKDTWVTNGHEYQSRIKYSTSLFFRYQVIEQIGIRFGAAYARKGYELHYTWDVPAGDNGIGDPKIPQRTDFALDYIDIPVLLYFSVIRKEKFRLAPSAGYMLSYLINSSEKSEMGDGVTRTTVYQDDLFINSSMKWVRFGVCADFKIKDRLFVSVEPYYTHGLNRPKTSITGNTYAGGILFSLNYWLYKKERFN